MNRQQKWRLKREEAGLCGLCGKPRDCDSDSLCYRCLLKKREATRAYYKCKPQIDGGRGRPQIPNPNPGE